MRKLMWPLSALALWTATPAVQGQFVQRYDPRLSRPYVPGVLGGHDPSGLRTRVIPGMPGVSGMFGQPHLPGFPGSPMGLQPWMPYSPQDILNDALSGHSGLPGYSGPRVYDPLAHQRGYPDLSINPLIQPGAPPLSLQGMPLTPRSFEQIHTSLGLKDFERKQPAQNGGTLPPWPFAVGVFVLAFVAGLLHALFGREANVG
jgi:hypothetical protein